MRQAAKTACIKFTNSLIELSQSVKKVSDAATALLVSVDKAHKAIIAEHEDMWQVLLLLYLVLWFLFSFGMHFQAGQTSLIGGMICRVHLKEQDRKVWGFIFVSVGNCKAFKWRKKDKSVVDLSPLHSSDILEFNSGDPGGRFFPFCCQLLLFLIKSLELVRFKTMANLT